MIKLRSQILIYWIGFRGEKIWRCWVYQTGLNSRRASHELVVVKSQPVEN